MKFTPLNSLLGLLFTALLFTACFKDDLLKEIDALRTQLADMQKRNDDLNKILNARADSLSQALTNAQKRSDSLSNVLKTKSDSLTNALGITNANLLALTKSVDSIKVQVANISGQLTQLNIQLTSITTQLNQLNQQMGALGADFAAINAKYQELSTSLQNLTAQIAALQAEQLKLLEKLNAIMMQMNPPVDITSGLVAYYPFSGNAGDSSGNGNHGTVINAELTTDRFNKPNTSYHFNGFSSFISVPSSNELNLLNDFTISLWIKQSTLLQSGNIFFLLAKNNGITGTGPWTFQVAKFGNNYLPHYTADPCFCLENINAVNPVFNLNSLNTWYYITASYSRITSDLKIYINGSIFSQKNNFQYQNKLNETPLIIGKNSCSTCIPGFYNGEIDDVRIYNRALTQAEITYLANN